MEIHSHECSCCTRALDILVSCDDVPFHWRTVTILTDFAIARAGVKHGTLALKRIVDGYSNLKLAYETDVQEL